MPNKLSLSAAPAHVQRPGRPDLGVFEAIFGTLFLAVLVSRLVGLYRD